MTRPPAAGLPRFAGRLLASLRGKRGDRHAGRADGPRLTSWEGLSLLVLPDVPDPVAAGTGAALAGAVARRLRTRRTGPTGMLRVLDLGCGSGIVAVAAAREGAVAVAVDLSPEAVRNTCMNALLNRLEERVDVRGGDLFAPVANLVFDVVAFSPPPFAGRPANLREMALRSEDAFDRFCAGLPSALAPSGEAVVLLPKEGDAPARRRLLEATGLELVELLRPDAATAGATVVLARSPVKAPAGTVP